MLIRIFTAFFLLTTLLINAKIIEYTEDAYSLQAPTKIVQLTEKAADFFDFTTPYEVIVPKKAGIQINPWNKFIVSDINPQTKNPFIIIDQEWFSKIPADQQLFLLGYNFLRLKHGILPWTIYLLSFASIIVTLLLALLFFWLLGKTPLIHQKKWIRAVAAYVLVMIVNIVVHNTIAAKIQYQLIMNHDVHLCEMVLQKTHNKQAALKALEFYDTSVKEEIKNGETFFVPHEKIFENLASLLRK